MILYWTSFQDLVERIFRDLLVGNMQICVACVRSQYKLTMHTLRSVDNEAKNYLPFEYCLPTSQLISYVKTILNHWSREVGRSGLRLNRFLTRISEKLACVCIWKCFDTPKSARSGGSNIQLVVFIDIVITIKELWGYSSVIICTFVTQMDRQIVDPGLNINEIQYITRRTRLATSISKWKENIGIAAVLIVARHRIIMLDFTVLSLKNLVQFW